MRARVPLEHRVPWLVAVVERTLPLPSRVLPCVEAIRIRNNLVEGVYIRLLDANRICKGVHSHACSPAATIQTVLGIRPGTFMGDRT